MSALTQITPDSKVTLTYTAPDETTDTAGIVRICEVCVDMEGTQHTALYRFNLNTGDLCISVVDQVATINTAPILGRLIQAARAQHAQAH